MLGKRRHSKIKLEQIKHNKSFEIDAKKSKVTKTIDELLQPIEDLHFETSSNYSEISDMFEDIHKESLYSTQRNLTKREIDIMTMDLFTPDFKETIKKTREDLNLPVCHIY